MQVRLRKIAMSDTANIVKWRNSDKVRHWLYSQDDLTEEMHLGWLKNVVGTGRCAQYIIDVEDEGHCFDIGTTFIKRTSSNSTEGEFGIFIGESMANGKHYSLPATNEMLRIGFEELMLQNIFLTVFEENIPAVKTYHRAGFVITAKYPYEEDNNRAVLRMEITNQQYFELHHL